jgi:hypothetical protein
MRQAIEYRRSEEDQTPEFHRDPKEFAEMLGQFYD